MHDISESAACVCAFSRISKFGSNLISLPWGQKVAHFSMKSQLNASLWGKFKYSLSLCAPNINIFSHPLSGFNHEYFPWPLTPVLLPQATCCVFMSYWRTAKLTADNRRMNKITANMRELLRLLKCYRTVMHIYVSSYLQLHKEVGGLGMWLHDPNQSQEPRNNAI